MVIGERVRPVQRLLQRRDLHPQPATGQLGQRLRIPAAADQRLHDLPGGHPVQIRDHHRQLQQSILEQLLGSLLLPGTLLGQMPTVAGQRTQPSDLLRRHETARDHAPLGDLGQPHAVGSIRLRPAGQRLDLLGVQQVAVEPLGLQPEERRLPVIRRCLHHHRRHPMAAQPVGHRQDLPLGRAEAAHLVRPPVRVRLARHPDTGFQRALADIECSHPLHVQRLVVDLLHHPPHLHLDAATCATGRGAEGDTEIWPACSKRQGTTLNENRLPASDSSTDSRRAPRSYDVTDGHPPIFTRTEPRGHIDSSDSRLDVTAAARRRCRAHRAPASRRYPTPE